MSNIKTMVECISSASKVLKDKLWYTLWNFDLFEHVERIYPGESYYNFVCNLLTTNASHIQNNIHLGNAFNAADYNWLCQNKITTIINVTSCLSNYYPDNFEYHNFESTDLNNSSMMNHYEECYQLIINNPHKIFLIHCFAGKSRSASLVLYYLIKHNDSFDLFER